MKESSPVTSLTVENKASFPQNTAEGWTALPIALSQGPTLWLLETEADFGCNGGEGHHSDIKQWMGLSAGVGLETIWRTSNMYRFQMAKSENSERCIPIATPGWRPCFTGGGNCFFSTMDLTSGFYNIPIHEDDRKYTACSTPAGLYEYNRMTQGLCNSPATFAKMMTSIFGDQNYLSLLCYLDDLPVFGKSEQEALDRLVSLA